MCRWLKNAFSAPKIWTVPAGSLANLIRPWALTQSRAANNGPSNFYKEGK